MKHDIILAYLNAMLTWPLIAGLLGGACLWLFHQEIRGFIARLAHIKLFGSEASAPHQLPPAPSGNAEIDIGHLETSPPEENDPAISEKLLDAERLAATLWEFRYLNYYLAMGTQWVLNWFVSQKSNVPESLYNATWGATIASANDRDAIINALKLHGLIELDVGSNCMRATQKGRTYAHWLGRYGMNHIPTTVTPLALPQTLPG